MPVPLSVQAFTGVVVVESTVPVEVNARCVFPAPPPTRMNMIIMFQYVPQKETTPSARGRITTARASLFRRETLTAAETRVWDP